MKSGYVLAIDQGTTGTKVMIFDHGVDVRARAYNEHRQIYPQPGWVEHDPIEIWETTHRLIGDALAEAGIAASDVAAIGITNQRETVVVWDRATGKPITNAIVWQDRRTSEFCDELKARGLETMVRAKTGLVIDPYFQIPETTREDNQTTITYELGNAFCAG